jgi:RNA polymerase sigma-70 factor, ECF subfamily
MNAEEREILERSLRAHHDAEDFRAVATSAIEAYGPEVLGFLVNLLGDHQDAGDVFSIFCEDVWSGLPGFRWQSSFRTWAYTLARNAAHRFRDDPHDRRRVSLSQSPQVFEIEERVRTATLTHLRTESKERVRVLRDALEPDDQALLVLRVDREMAWNDIARILLGAQGEADERAIARKAAALRKRFERVKELLRARLDEERARSQ